MPSPYTLVRTLERRGVSSKHSQSGVVLVISLIFLTLMTMLALTAMRSTILQEHMTGNLRDREMAFQAAEAALREGERQLSASTEINQPLGEAINQPLEQWTGKGGKSYSLPDAAGVAADPIFYIGPSVHEQIYTVTARGVGGRSSSVVILQSLFKPVQSIDPHSTPEEESLLNRGENELKEAFGRQSWRQIR